MSDLWICSSCQAARVETHQGLLAGGSQAVQVTLNGFGPGHGAACRAGAPAQVAYTRSGRGCSIEQTHTAMQLRAMMSLPCAQWRQQTEVMLDRTHRHGVMEWGTSEALQRAAAAAAPPILHRRW